MRKDEDGRGSNEGPSNPPASEGDPDGQSRRENLAKLAEERTDWAMERTLLAKQRTFTAWLRTGLAGVVAGFAAAQLLGDVHPGWLVQVASALMLASGAMIFVIGYRGYRSTFRKLEREGIRGIPPLRIAGITVAFFVAALLLLAAILVE